VNAIRPPSGDQRGVVTASQKLYGRSLQVGLSTWATIRASAVSALTTQSAGTFTRRPVVSPLTGETISWTIVVARTNAIRRPSGDHEGSAEPSASTRSFAPLASTTCRRPLYEKPPPGPE